MDRETERCSSKISIKLLLVTFSQTLFQTSVLRFATGKKDIELFHMLSIIFSFRCVRNTATNITFCQVLFQEQMTAESQEEATSKQNTHTKNFPKLS